jgi:hypothetical protein
MSERVVAGIPAIISGARYIVVPVPELVLPSIVWVNPACVTPLRNSAEITCPIPKSVSFTNGAGEEREERGEGDPDL